MAGVVELLEGISNGLDTGPDILLTLLFFTAVIVLYAVFVYYFYRFLARKNLIELNLNQYNQYQNPALAKFFAGVFYVSEYLILLPVITFFWFGVLAILILILSEGMEVGNVLLISAALVAAVRITSYVSESLSKDLAKMLPFTLIAIAITKPGFFAVESMINRISEIPSLFSNIPHYLAFIVGIELIMRTLTIFEKLFKTGDMSDEESKVEEEPETK